MNYIDALNMDLIFAETIVNERYKECLKDENYICTDFELASFRLCLESQELRRQNDRFKKELEETNNKIKHIKVYKCDPNKNTKCNKKSCYINGGPCDTTTDKNYAEKETLENKEEVLEKAIDLISKHLTSEILNNYALKLERNNSDDYNCILEEAINLMASQLTTPVNDIDFVKDYYIKEAKKKITKEK